MKSHFEKRPNGTSRNEEFSNWNKLKNWINRTLNTFEGGIG